MKMENEIYRRFNNIEDLEFKLLKEVKVEDFNINCELFNKFEDLLNYNSRNYNFGIVVKVLENKIIVRSPNDSIYLIKTSSFKLKDIIVFKGDKIIKIEDKIFDEKFLDELNEKRRYEMFDLDNFKMNETLFKEKLEYEILSFYQKGKLEEAKKQKEFLEEEKKEKKEDEEREKEFKEKSIGKFSAFEVDKNILIIEFYQGKNIFIFKKNVNELFDYDVFDNERVGFSDISNLSSFENYIIKNKIDYTKEKQKEGKEKIKLYDLEFEKKEDYPKIKGVRIPQNKIGFILSRIRKEQTKEQIELLKKLTGMKIDLLNLNEISCAGHTIEISISLIDENNFEIEFMNKKEKLDWETLKEFFFCGGSSRSVNSFLGKKTIFDLCKLFGLSKIEVFDYLKKLKMLEELK